MPVSEEIKRYVAVEVIDVIKDEMRKHDIASTEKVIPVSVQNTLNNLYKFLIS